MTTVCLAASAVLVVTLFAILAPGLLCTGDIPRKADAVVLFVGPGNEDRLDEAKRLIREGYARYLIISASGEFLTADAASRLVWTGAGKQTRGDFLPGKRIVAGYSKYFENTHIEALEAKRMMETQGLRSALLVSSGYHMRRVRLIADRVFDDRYAVSCIPPRSQKPFRTADWLDSGRCAAILGEYAKMAWFGIYEPLSRRSRSDVLPSG